MAKPSVSLRLDLEGKEAVKSAFAEVEAAGDATAKRLAGEFRRASEDMEQAERRMADAVRKAATAGITDSSGALSGQGQQLAAQQAAAKAAQEGARLDAQRARQAEALRVAIDPLYAAQKRYNAEVERASTLLRANAITEAEHARAVGISTAALEEVRQAQQRGAANDNARRASIQNLGFQIQDFAVQVTGGTSALKALAMQGPQALGAIAAMGGGATESASKFARFASFLGGPWGVAITTGITLAGALATKLLESGDSADAATAGLARYGNSLSELAQRARETDQAIRTLNASAGAQRMSQIDDTTTDWLLAQGKVTELRDKIAKMAAPTGRNANFGDVFAGERAQLENDLVTAQGLVETTRRQRDILIKNNEKASAREGASAIVEQTRRQTDLATAVSATERARAALAIVEARGTEAATTGGAALRRYQSDLTAAKQAVNAAEAAEKSATAGRRALTRETNAAAREQKRLVELVQGLTQAYEGGGGFKLYSERKAAIGEALAKGFITDEQAQRAGQQAMSEYMDSLEREADQRAARLKEIVSSSITEAGPLIDPDKVVVGKISTGVELVKQITPEMQKLRDAGADFAERVLSPDAWREWGSSGKSMVKELENAFIKLALINPLKNLISGDNKAQTLSGLLGSVGKLFGGGLTGAQASAGINWASLNSMKVPGFASGTEYAPGGLALVGEMGREIVSLPRGARVTPAADTRRLLAANDGAARRPMVVNATVNNRFDVGLETMDERIAMATQQAGPAIARGVVTMLRNTGIGRA